MKQIIKQFGNCQSLIICLCLFFLTNCKKGTSKTENIIYTDISPDQTFDTIGSVYHLDLNNDGKTDFDIAIITYTDDTHCGPGGSVPVIHKEIGITPYGLNEVAGNVLAADIALNDTISSTSLPWINDYLKLDYVYQGISNQPHACSVSWTSGYEGGGTPIGPDGNGYIGLELNINNNVNFGWLRYDPQLSNPPSITVIDYAYNSIANQLILAGQTK
jgi:hypothetical protein